MKCSKCGQEVPADAIYCPHWSGDRKTTDQEAILAGICCWAIGLFLGRSCQPSGVLFHFGAERGIKAIAFIVPAVTFTTGLIIGLVKAKREWK